MIVTRLIVACLSAVFVLGQVAWGETGHAWPASGQERAPALWSARDLLGAEVRDAGNDSLGTVSDAIFHGHRLRQLVLSVGGVFGIGAHRVIVDYEALEPVWYSFGPGFVYPPGEEALSELPEYERGSVRPHNRLNWLLAEPVWNAAEEWIGFIDDVFLAQDEIVAVIIPVGGFLGIGSHRVAVRLDDLEDDGESFLLDASRDELLAADSVDYERILAGEQGHYLDGAPIASSAD